MHPDWLEAQTSYASVLAHHLQAPGNREAGMSGPPHHPYDRYRDDPHLIPYQPPMQSYIPKKFRRPRNRQAISSILLDIGVLVLIIVSAAAATGRL